MTEGLAKTRVRPYDLASGLRRPMGWRKQQGMVAVQRRLAAIVAASLGLL
jgi:hypothetical protein